MQDALTVAAVLVRFEPALFALIRDALPQGWRPLPEDDLVLSGRSTRTGEA